MKNALKSRGKFSKIELKTNYYIIVIVSMQFVICIFASLYDNVWAYTTGINISYLGF